MLQHCATDGCYRLLHNDDLTLAVPACHSPLIPALPSPTLLTGQLGTQTPSSGPDGPLGEAKLGRGEPELRDHGQGLVCTYPMHACVSQRGSLPHMHAEPLLAYNA